MRIALFHNLPSGGAKRTVYEQVRRLARSHSVYGYAITTANRDFFDVSPYLSAEHVTPYEPWSLLRSPVGRLNQAIRIANLLRLRRIQRRIAEAISSGGYDAAIVHPCMFTFSPTLLRHLSTPSVYYRQDPVRWVHDPSPTRPRDKNGRLRRSLDAVDPLRASYRRLLVHEDRTSMLAATRVVTSSCFMHEI